jgi:alkylation response protein AidB-like acyl-CoA dehydrogenase
VARALAWPAAPSRAHRNARARVVFGRKLGCMQLIWDKVAEMSWRIDTAELLTYRAAKLYDAGARPATYQG